MQQVPLVAMMAFGLLAAACGAESVEDPAVVPIAFETILDESQTGLDEPLREVVRDGERWADLWAQIHRPVLPRPPLPAVDFSRHMLIAVGLGTRRSSGFRVAVQDVVVHGGRIEVKVVENCPEPGGMVGMALTQPVQVVRIDRLARDAGFRDTRSPSCE